MVLPLLNFVEAWKQGDGNKDDNCFFAMANFELYGVGQWFVSRSETLAIQRSGHSDCEIFLRKEQIHASPEPSAEMICGTTQLPTPATISAPLAVE